ncbi:MAG TPA: ATP-dependent 6-phosphofructokinase [Firmicutes bacterium]|uniref:ATP-dependent 6-phosphofructokinase n=1 Tax=Candidatus Coatesbacteria bacterium 4484_99 TaxID=1970774 RepID=A0A1W9S2E0_9BACT|nr:MAG: ATP-dependent 6-phosphofructokinase [Candidatus Coatesbacteria bacterium 4484_99]RLC43376.1 MAG: ATP-dependent 6-phosphofructokinase [Candidatus Coatesbacteria bacterium]RLC44865.1 MAG: ATP-dependent 6-phosphofructokinase [Candidatus Coatesbacteria bacterium]HDM43324.1 ATP-dependent 6-phosphofructokinase [Bacillota bacterium]
MNRKPATFPIGIITSGGDAPGMNAAIRAVVRDGLDKNLLIYGIHSGYQGLIDDEVDEMEMGSVSGIINRGGTILRSGRSMEFYKISGMEKAYKTCMKYGIEGLIIIGGDGTIRGANEFHKNFGINVVCLPASIDNDIYGTQYAIGYDTAINTAVSALDRVRETAESHERIFVVEVMGRDSGAIASAVALASGAEYVFVPEEKRNIKELVSRLVQGVERGKGSFIIVVAEGVSSAYDIARNIEDKTSRETRVLVLGHLQRGGPPTANDRILGSILGAKAVDVLLSGEKSSFIGIEGTDLVVRKLSQVVGRTSEYPRKYYELALILGK